MYHTMCNIQQEPLRVGAADLYCKTLTRDVENKEIAVCEYFAIPKRRHQSTFSFAETR